MFESSRSLDLFETHRIPYRVTTMTTPVRDGARLEVVRTGGRPSGALYFISWDGGADRLRPFRLLDAPLFGRLASDDVMAELLADATSEEWTRTSITAESNGAPASIWTNDDGSVAFPFDPDEVTFVLLSEGYQNVGTTPLSVHLGRIGKRVYYAARPFLFSASRTWVRRWFARVQRRTRFPRWPAETVLHDFHEFVLDTLAGVAGRPIPVLGFWPAGHTWALVLTHDVETAAGYASVHLLREVERNAGFRSSWNFVPKRYTTDDADIRSLSADGFEVGVHGLYHDGHDLGSVELIRDRLPEIRAWAERWQAVGFRSPSTHRRWEWMPMLQFDYDMSYSDTAPYEPQPGGCCCWLPFFIDSLVEIPITLPQDHTMFVVLDQKDATMWDAKTEFIRSRGGMAHMLTHPDYMTDPARIDAYRRYLARYQDDSTAWKALPRDVANWWRRRAASQLVRSDDQWRIVGPAAEDGVVTFAGTGKPHA